MKDYYQLLGVSPNAGSAEIKLAYRNLAKRFHPDRNPGNTHIEDHFKEISEAYNVLSDEENRRKYDLKRAYRFNRQEHFKREETRTTGPRKTRGTGKTHSYSKTASREETKNERLTSYLFGGALVFFAALMITMLIVGPWNSANDDALNSLSRIKAPDFSDRKAIFSADSPYDSIFGGSWILDGNHNSVIVVNTNQAEVVVCLQETNAPHRTIRNEYLESGESYRLNAIPQGTYFIKAYFGRDWDPELRLDSGKVKGGFRRPFGYFKSDNKENLIHISHKNEGDNLVFTTYQVYLANLFKQPGKEMQESEFFR